MPKGKPARIDVTGHTYGYLTVTGFSHLHPKSRHAVWKCQCVCGNETLSQSRLLRNGQVQSCGCKKSEQPAGPKAYGWKGYGSISRTKFHSYRNGAERRGLLFAVTIEDLWNKLEQQDFKCALSGLAIKLPSRIKKFSESTASLDRIDPRKGYTPDNIQWVHKDINVMKMAMQQDYFLRLCDAVSCRKRVAEFLKCA